MDSQKLDGNDGWELAKSAFFSVALVAFLLFMGYALFQGAKPENLQKAAENRAQAEREEKFGDALKGADAMLQKAETDAMRASWQLNRACALVRLHRFDDALAAYAQAQKLDPGAYGKRGSCVVLARALAEAHQYEQAVALWEQLLRDFPDEEHVLSSYGLFLLRTNNAELNDPVRALALIRRYVEISTDSDRSNTRRCLSWALAANGLFDEAIRECDRTKELVIKEHADLVAQMEERHKRSAQNVSLKVLEYRRKEIRALQDAHERELERIKKMRAQLESQEPPEELITPHY